MSSRSENELTLAEEKLWGQIRTWGEQHKEASNCNLCTHWTGLGICKSYCRYMVPYKECAYCCDYEVQHISLLEVLVSKGVSPLLALHLWVTQQWPSQWSIQNYKSVFNQAENSAPVIQINVLMVIINMFPSSFGTILRLWKFLMFGTQCHFT